jgi:hypothetical protein
MNGIFFWNTLCFIENSILSQQDLKCKIFIFIFEILKDSGSKIKKIFSKKNWSKLHWHYTWCATTFSTITLSRTTLSITLEKHDPQFNDTKLKKYKCNNQHTIMLNSTMKSLVLSVIMPNVIILSVMAPPMMHFLGTTWDGQVYSET